MVFQSPVFFPYALDCSLVSGQCGNGIVDIDVEQCDDGNNITGDGCNGTCHVEEHFVCTTSTGTPSDCVAILLDLNTHDNTTLHREDLEYFDLDTPVFLVDPAALHFFVRPETVSSYRQIVSCVHKLLSGICL